MIVGIFMGALIRVAQVIAMIAFAAVIVLAFGIIAIWLYRVALSVAQSMG